MAIDWWINKTDPKTGELAPDDTGYMHSFEMEDIDFMLVGGSDGMVLDGPVATLYHAGKSVPGTDGTETICPRAAVKHCAKRLATLPADRLAPSGAVFKHLNWSFDEMSDDDRRDLYEALVTAANEFRALVADAAAHNYALKFGIGA